MHKQDGPSGALPPNNRRRRQSDVERTIFMNAFARIDGTALTVAVAAVCAVGFFLATATLLIKGAPPGVPIGPNLAAFSTFLPRYSVTWTGAAVGAAYAAVFGGVAGWVVAALWNATHFIFIGVAVLRANWLD
jgi:hypothetical protein